MAKPLVVSDIGAFADTVVHEKTGLAAAVDNPSALAAALTRLLTDRAFARRLGENGRTHAQRFTLARTVADTETLLAAIRKPAERHYRIGVSVARAIALPFRLLPIFLRVIRVLRRHRFSLLRRGFKASAGA